MIEEELCTFRILNEISDMRNHSFMYGMRAYKHKKQSYFDMLTILSFYSLIKNANNFTSIVYIDEIFGKRSNNIILL